MGSNPAAAQPDTVETTTPPPPPPPPSSPVPPARHRRLRRDRSHRVLGGVAAGIAETYGVDVMLVRVLWIIAAIAWIGIPAYVVAWIAIPAGDGDAGDADLPRDFGMLIALALIGVGVLVAVDQVLPGAWHAGRVSGPLLLVGAGVAILLLRRPNGSDTTVDSGSEPASTGTEAGASGEPSPAPTEAAALAAGAGNAPPPASAWTQTAEWPTPPPPGRDERRAHRRRRPRPFLTPIALSVLLIGAGVASFLQSIDAIDLNLTIAFAIATCFVGAVLALSAWIGRAHGLIVVGVLLAFATAVSSTINVPLHGGFGDRSYRPATTAELQPAYELSAGTIHLDLRQLAPITTTDVAVTVGFGEINVDVPSTVTVDVVAKAGAGQIELFGHSTNGWHAEDHRTAVGAGSAPATVHLDLRVGAGHIIVRRWDDGNETILRGRA
jgi:phage shock protein PspC (stress-responsive transcriptional regulator)/predicted membrane protein